MRKSSCTRPWEEPIGQKRITSASDAQSDADIEKDINTNDTDLEEVLEMQNGLRGMQNITNYNYICIIYIVIDNLATQFQFLERKKI